VCRAVVFSQGESRKTLAALAMHDLVYPLVGDAKQPREFGLRVASGVAGTDDDIAFTGGKRWIRRRGLCVEPGEDVGYGGIHRL